ncbi:hypothetical protein PHLGIDRAFT_431428 [Phlebiopsis gigantea 11061_1 CR5-6]|uniref:Uncharacterized protein n=1 Tax=Phlebiopsis gigantea (strain 11061_1 CR5-6) TaxID=745531 RepID=A0A0C3RYE9_PHLG1|nr:hypothetical protein PHLGIDRAFT_431428 [Phlebiopsis gigantea 11061_1 CR5-6]
MCVHTHFIRPARILFEYTLTLSLANVRRSSMATTLTFRRWQMIARDRVIPLRVCQVMTRNNRLHCGPPLFYSPLSVPRAASIIGGYNYNAYPEFHLARISFVPRTEAVSSPSHERAFSTSITLDHSSVTSRHSRHAAYRQTGYPITSAVSKHMRAFARCYQGCHPQMYEHVRRRSSARGHLEYC